MMQIDLPNANTAATVKTSLIRPSDSTYYPHRLTPTKLTIRPTFAIFTQKRSKPIIYIVPRKCNNEVCWQTFRRR